MAIVNSADFSMGFWIMLGVLAALLLASLFTGVFRKVA